MDDKLGLLVVLVAPGLLVVRMALGLLGLLVALGPWGACRHRSLGRKCWGFDTLRFVTNTRWRTFVHWSHKLVSKWEHKLDSISNSMR